MDRSSLYSDQDMKRIKNKDEKVRDASAERN